MKETTYEFITIKPLPVKPGRKTGIYSIVSRSQGTRLAVIQWYGSWRQYCFFPEEDTVWNAGCLADVQDFLAKLKEERG